MAAVMVLLPTQATADGGENEHLYGLLLTEEKTNTCTV